MTKLDKKKYNEFRKKERQLNKKIREYSQKGDIAYNDRNELCKQWAKMDREYLDSYMEKFKQHNWWIENNGNLYKAIVTGRSYRIYMTVNKGENWETWCIESVTKQDFQEQLRSKLYDRFGKDAKLVALKKKSSIEKELKLEMLRTEVRGMVVENKKREMQSLAMTYDDGELSKVIEQMKKIGG